MQHKMEVEGRLSIYYSNNSFIGVLDTRAGDSPQHIAKPGTYYWAYKDGTIPVINLTVDYDVALVAGNYTFGNLTVTSSNSLWAYGSNITNVNNDSIGIQINAQHITIEAGAAIRSDGYGCGYSASYGAGADTSYRGGSYGGLGGSQTDNSKIYGSGTEPIALGSGGKREGSGGGAIKLNSTNDIVINGNISVYGAILSVDEGGSGGSIWLVASGNISGTGKIVADGADGTNNPGGGGRIAVYAKNFTFSGVIENKGGLDTGASNNHASAGTVYINASESITMSGNISATGYNGTTAMINITDTLITMSGTYLTNSSVEPQGKTTINYTNCASSFVGAVFNASAVYETGCEDENPPIIYLEGPANNTLNDTSNTPDFSFNVTHETAEKLDCLLWLRDSEGANQSYGENSSTVNATTTTIIANTSLSNGDFLWWVNCSDGTNTNVSEMWNISINYGLETPFVNIVTVSPNITGLGQTINITANVTDGVQAVWLGISVSGTQTNYTMTNDTMQIFNYTYAAWNNGTHSVIVYANNSFNNLGTNSTQLFEIFNDNITVQIRTLQDSYQNNTFINLTDPPGGGIGGGLEKLSERMSGVLGMNGESGPEISNAYTDPYDVVPGDKMLVSADVRDDSEIRKVEVDMPHEKGVDVLDMVLESGDKFDGTWQTVWDVHDTLEKNYTSIIRAENEDGMMSEKEVGWSDSVSLCYQESTNQSTAGDGDCGLNYSGSYDLTGGQGAELIDGDWDTDYAGFNLVYINYTIPDSAQTSSFLQVKDTGGMANLTIPDSCWDYDPYVLHIAVYLGACFIGGTEILMADGSYKPIEEISVGEYVISYDNITRKDIASKVIKTIINPPGSVSDYIIIINGVVGVTPTHPFLINREWQAIGNARIGDNMTDVNGENLSITSLERVYEKVLTYNLEVENTHNYYAADLRVHNVCFLAGTKIIMADNNYKNIEDVKDGDYVVSYDEKTNEKVISKVTKTIAHNISEMGDYYLIVNNKIKATPNHPFLINREWQEIGNAKIGDNMIDINGENLSITSLERVYEKVLTYNLEVENTHNYYAEEVLVHNKGGHCWYCINNSNYIARIDLYTKNPLLRSGPGSLFEEAMWWNISKANIITYTEFAGKGETTNLTVLNLAANTNVSNLILDDAISGKIKYLEEVTLNDSFNLDSVIDYSNNNISVNNTAYAGALNKSAEITMYNLPFGYPKILKDGVECAAPNCNILSWDASIGQVVFNVSSFSGYEAAEANQSKVQNNGTNNMSFYLLMKTQFYNAGTWQDEDIVINDSATSTLRTVYRNATNLIKLDEIWNAELYNSSNLSSGDGIYRVYVALQDDNSNVLNDSEGNSLSASFNFTLDNAKPTSIVLNGPANNSEISTNYNNVSFNWTATDSLDNNLSCNLTIGSVVKAMNVQSSSGVMMNYTVNNLAVGDYLWNVTCWDDALNVNTSTTWNLSIYQANNPPTTTTPIITPAPTATATDDLNCSFMVSDPDDGDSLSVNITWYNDDEDAYNVSAFGVTNASYTNTTLLAGNTSAGENWTCGVIPYDGTDFGVGKNSSSIYINNLPTVTLTDPDDNNQTPDRTPKFSWSPDADDNLTYLTYDFNLSCQPGCGVDNRLVEGLDEIEYTPTKLLYLNDRGKNYTWQVRAYDGYNYGIWTDARTIMIDAYLDISLTNTNISFGNLTINEIENTTDDNPSPFELQNDGNCIANISIEGLQLFESSEHPSKYFQFKADNSSELVSFNWQGSLYSWTNLPSSTTHAITELNDTDDTDTVEIDIKVEVPPEEAGGDRESTITFTESLAE